MDANGIFYGFKLLNDSGYHVLDVKIEVNLKTPFNSNGGLNYSSKKIRLKTDRVMQFPRHLKNDKQAEYAIIIATRDDLESLWTDPAQFLEIKVHGKHSLSGISESFQQKYYTKKSCIKDGIFNFGNTFDIS